MKLITVFLICVFSFSFNFFAQSDNEVGIFYSDTVYRYQGLIPPVEFKYDLKQFFRYPLTKRLAADVLFSDDPSTIWLRTEMLISHYSFYSNVKESDTHFTSSLHKQFLEDSEFDMVRYLLGMAQLSAVAYMAYRHIKKYGFLK